MKKAKHAPRTQPAPETQCAPGISWDVHNRIANLARPTDSPKPDNAAISADSPKPANAATEKTVEILVSSWPYVSRAINLKLTESQYKNLMGKELLDDAYGYLRTLAPARIWSIYIMVLGNDTSKGMVVIRVKSDRDKKNIEDIRTVWSKPKA